MYRVKIRKKPEKYGFTPDDVQRIKYIITHPEGWCSKGHTFIFSKQTPHAIIGLYPEAYMNGTFKQPRFNNLSVTDTGSDPRQVYIHLKNWYNPPHLFIGSRELYRAYLIQHELGHCLGYGHVNAPLNSSDPCPVMYQQTKGTLDICQSNSIVLS